MDETKSNLIREIKGMMNGGGYRSRGYDSLAVHKTVDKLLIRLGIIVIIGLLGYIAIKNNRRCK